MRRWLIPLVGLLALGVAAPAAANDISDCGQYSDLDRTVRGCSGVIAAARTNRAILAVAYANRGSAYLRKGDTDRAYADAMKAIDLNPKYADAYALRGIAYGQKGDYDSEIADETKTIELAPRNAVAYEARAFAYAAKGDYDRSIADATRAIEINPENATAYDRRAFAYGQKGDPAHELTDAGKAIEINPGYASAYNDRGAAYGFEGDYISEIADETKAIELDPNSAAAYDNRAFAHIQRGELDAGIADDTRAIELSPQFGAAYSNRGNAYGRKGAYNEAIADETKAIELDPKNSAAYGNRGFAYRKKGDYDSAIADESMSIALAATNPAAFANRGYAYGGKGDYDREIADQSQAITLKPDFGPAYYGRGEAYAAKGDLAKALVDFRVAAPLIAASDERHALALARIGEIEKQLASAAPAAAAPGPAAQAAVDAASGGSPVKDLAAQLAEAKAQPNPAPVNPQPAIAAAETRLALVIGNSGYTAVAKLPNPEHDAEAIAAALKADGFEVTTVGNLARADFISAINRFSDAAGKADWAVIYFAGHGLQLDGVNYLVPTDARLAADRDVPDEAIALDRMIGAVSGARRLGLIIVDACRNNPFLTSMRFTVAGRAAHTRGLARIAPQGTTLIEFSARDGQEAMDGDPTGNSPFAAALAKRLATPGLEVGKLLRQVRQDVLAATANQQEPMFSGDLPAEDVFFRSGQ